MPERIWRAEWRVIAGNGSRGFRGHADKIEIGVASAEVNFYHEKIVTPSEEGGDAHVRRLCENLYKTRGDDHAFISNALAVVNGNAGISCFFAGARAHAPRRHYR